MSRVSLSLFLVTAWADAQIKFHWDQYCTKSFNSPTAAAATLLPTAAISSRLTTSLQSVILTLMPLNLIGIHAKRSWMMRNNEVVFLTNATEAPNAMTFENAATCAKKIATTVRGIKIALSGIPQSVTAIVSSNPLVNKFFFVVWTGPGKHYGISL